MTNLIHEITVPEDGVVTLPPEWRGVNVAFLTRDDEHWLRLVQASNDFRHKKSLDQIRQEQNVKPIRDVMELSPREAIWEGDDDFFAFLRDMGRDVQNFQSIGRIASDVE